ncbi:YkvA family protein [Herminiimonas sp.]|uniref:YkvA family protein n=1 Tax=Herminiimonas sp. TaxID=1926289 RepID=UPI002728A551|nr:YkvA family protein [Herminiimonas sp.]MDO8304716.1 YkvA family protein [Herminiimonas sp.]
MLMNEAIKNWARRIKRDAVMLWFARRHPDTPLLAKVICVLAVLYALSPIDLVPDFVPILGYVDDALLLPAMIWLAVRLLPSHVVALCRAQADDWMTVQGSKPQSYIGAAIIVALWLVFAYLCWRWI